MSGKKSIAQLAGNYIAISGQRGLCQRNRNNNRKLMTGIQSPNILVMK